MATLTLGEYISRAENLLKEESYERVITMCQFGLRSYPRCVDFYRLLGQACLETDRPDDAADMFRRVLGVDPQNFVARVGLGVVAEGIGAVDEALWQWERALELEPNHGEVREEWQRLRAKRDNAAPGGRMKLNRAALGYIYQRGEQYERAAAEFRSVLAGIPVEAEGKHERFDLQVALAEALYRAGRQRAAGELCRQVLKILPNALKPNLILGDIDHETGREDEASLLFEQAQGLDPENSLASQLLNPPVRLPKRAITIDEPDSAAVFPALPLPAGAGPSRAFGAHEPAEMPILPDSEASDDVGLPDWLRTLRVHRSVVVPAPAASPRADGVERFDVAKAPEWLQEAADVNVHTPPPVAPSPDPAPVAELKTSPVGIEPQAPAPVAELKTPPVEIEPQAPAPVAEFKTPPVEIEPQAPAPVAELKTPPVEIEPQAPAPVAELKTSPVEIEPPAPAPSLREPVADARDVSDLPEWLRRLRQPESTESPASVAAEAGEEKTSDAPSPSHQTVAVAPETSASLIEPETSAVTPESAAALAPSWLAELAQLGAKVSESEPLPAGTRFQAVPAAVQGAGSPLPAAPSEPISAPVAASVSEPKPKSVTPVAAPPAQLSPALSQEPAPDVKESQPSVQLSPAVSQEAAPEVKAALPSAQAREDAALPVTPVPPAPRAATAYFDDSSAPPSVESQEAPSGAAVYQERLDLARVMKDIDLESALELYALMGGASAVLRGQAIAEVAAIAEQHPQAIETLQHLRLTEPVQPSLVTDPAKDLLADAVQPAVAPIPLTVEDAEATPALSASKEYLDDAAVPPSIEAQVVPTGAAQYAARLELARMLVDLDLDTALDQYELMEGASPTLVQQSIADLSALAASRSGASRAHAVLDLLQGSLPHAVSYEASSPAVARETIAPPAEEASGAAPAPGTSTAAMEAASAAAESDKTRLLVPVVSEEAMEAGTAVAESDKTRLLVPVVSQEVMEAGTAVAESDKTRLLVPVVSEEAMEAGTAVAGAQIEMPTLPVVDESLADEDRRAHIPRETAAHPARSAVPPSDEAQVSLPDWLADAVTPTPADKLAASAEPVVAEEAMEEALATPHAVAPPAVAPVVDEEMLSEMSPPAETARPKSIMTESVGPLTTDLSVHAAPKTPAEPVVAETIAPLAHEAPATTNQSIAATSVEPVIARTAAPVAHEAPATEHDGIAATPVEPVVAAVATQIAYEALVAAGAPEGKVAPQPVSAPREAVAFLNDALAPLSLEAQAAPSAAAEPQARLELARALLAIDLQESAAQYQSLVDRNALLPQVISDLQSALQVQPAARSLRVLLAEALARAGRHQEAVEHYRKLV
jgi:tetratricopeptide (TPR) repeat protein